MKPLTPQYRDEYDDAGHHVARTYFGDQHHPWSWRDEYDDAGRHVAHTVAGNPHHPWSWRLNAEVVKERR
jgi:hypothetical protein